MIAKNRTVKTKAIEAFIFIGIEICEKKGIIINRPARRKNRSKKATTLSGVKNSMTSKEFTFQLNLLAI